MAENIVYERAEYADEALQAYLDLPVNEAYGASDVIAETDAFFAGWEAGLNRLQAEIDRADLPEQVKSLAVMFLAANRAERIAE